MSLRYGQVRIELECAVEQRLARQAHNLEVVGSIPTGATFFPFVGSKSSPNSGDFLRARSGRGGWFP
jgi:hypothetical protein